MKNLEIKIKNLENKGDTIAFDVIVSFLNKDNENKIYYGTILLNEKDNTIDIFYNQETPNNIQVNIENIFTNIIKPEFTKNVNKHQLKLGL